MTRDHIFIPDCQVKPGVRTDHLEWAGKYIAERAPDVLVLGGDFWDMPSLSSYDKGKRSAEGRRISKDIDAGNNAMERLLWPIRKRRAAWKKMRREVVLGNHEQRIERYVDENAEAEGTVSYDDLNLRDWHVHDFLEVVKIDGVSYSHFFPRAASGAITQTKRGAPSARAQCIRQGGSATSGHQQGLDMTPVVLGGRLQWGLIAGCLTPDHKVLTSDLRYVPLGSIKPGDKLLSFDEFPEGRRGRRYKTGTVLQAKLDPAEVWEVLLASGKAFKVTADHVWLCRGAGSAYNWRRTDQLRKGMRIPRVLDEWEEARTYEAGWLSGMYDGEGHLYHRKTTGGHATQMGLSQKQGPTLDRIVSTIQTVLGDAPTTCTVQRDVMAVRLRGGVRAIVRALGTLRPHRLLSKFYPECMGMVTSRPQDQDAVVSVRPLGVMDIVRTEIDAGTYIVEGYPHHNSFYLHDESYLSPQGHDYWKGIVVKHDVHHGMYAPMLVDMRYLKRRFG